MAPRQAGDAAGFRTLDEEDRISSLSLALSVRDEATGKPLAVPARVRLQGIRDLPVRNPSGYYLFFDLPAGTYTVTIDADPYEYKEEPVTLPLPDHKNPVHEIAMKLLVKT